MDKGSRGSKVFSAVIVLMLGVGRVGNAQPTVNPPPQETGFLQENFRFSGELGTYGELYSIKGLTARRPPSTGRLFFRPTMVLFNALTLNFDFILSTEGSGARQDINQFGLHPSWSWGRGHIGDFTESYSDYTLSGILIRGAAVTINPGLVRFSALGGFTKRAVFGGADNGAYDRYLYGAKLGFGTDAGGFVDLMFLRVRDEISSLPSQTTTPVIDTLNPAATPIRQFEVTPQENLIAGIISSVNFLDNQVSWRLEATGSLFTRDMRVAADTTLKLPGFLKNIYRANVTSNVDLAVVTDVNVNVDFVNVRAGYKYIGPGYNSLGVASLLNDQQEFSLAPSFRVADWSVSLSWTRQNDNLLSQKLHTTVRNMYGANVSFRATAIWTTTIFANFLTMGNSAPNDTLRIDFTNFTLGTTQILTFAQDALFQNVMVNYVLQTSGDNSPLRTNTKSTTHSGTISTMIPVGESFSISPSAGLVHTKVALLRAQTIQTYGVSLLHRALENKLSTTLASTVSILGTANSYRNTLTSSYQLTASMSTALSVSMMNFRGNPQTGGKFDEYTGALTVSYRF
ncbi:MAG: hypothetical protein HY708_00865 [Ignavibacteriae bacterium]|nr:hypothetical protein [Ignavibacteriota bacterium]